MNENELVTLEQKEKNKKGKAKFLIIGTLVIIAIAVGLFFGYKKLNNNPMSVYKDAINNAYKSLSDALKENKNNSLDSIDITKDPVVIKADAKLESSIPELKNFTGYNYAIEMGMDYANKKMNVGLGVTENNNAILSLILSVIDKNIYLKSEELFNKVLDLGEEDIFGNLDLNSNFTVNGNNAKFDYDNYSYILKELKTIIIDSLDKNKLSMEKENSTFKKAIYNLDKENMERTLKFIKERILKDDKLIKAIAESLGVTPDELKKSLNEEINMDGYNNAKISLYTDKLNNLTGGTIAIENEGTLEFECSKDKFKIEIKSEDTSIVINKDKKDVYDISFSEKNVEMVKIHFEKFDDENARVVYSLNIEGNIVTGNILIKNAKSTKDSMSFDMKITFNTTVLGKPIDFSLDGSYSIAKTDVKTLDSVGSVKIDSISEEEAMEIFTKLSTILERFGLSDLVSSIM